MNIRYPIYEGVYRILTEGGLCGGQDRGARQCEGRPRTALHEISEVQPRERQTADLFGKPRPRADRCPVE